MIKKKLCMLGATRVGKTTLVQRFAQNIFSDKYHQTVGVKIDKKQLTLNGRELSLLLWDVQGEDDSYRVRPSYLRGASGYVLVVDGTRPETFDTACNIQERAQDLIGSIPFVMIINKADLAERWVIDEGVVQERAAQGWTVTRTSAMTGQGVNEAFLTLASRMIDAGMDSSS